MSFPLNFPPFCLPSISPLPFLLSFHFSLTKFASLLLPTLLWNHLASARKSKNYSADWYFERIRYLGYVFEYEIELYDEYIKFQDVLDVVDQSNISMYDTQDKFEFKVGSMNSMKIQSEKMLRAEQSQASFFIFCVNINFSSVSVRF